MGSGSSYRIELGSGRVISGNAFTHVEGNHGSFFPAGWTWAQGIGRGNNCSFSLIGGIYLKLSFLVCICLKECINLQGNL